MTDLVLGIDTGGTYTDGALLDYHTREVLATTKTLTTHHDLSICILKALSALLPEDTADIRLVSISTTLATNAIAEGKGRPVGLFLMGYDPELVRSFRFESQFATTHYDFFAGGHTLNGEPQAAPDLRGMRVRAQALENNVEAFAVSGYFSPFNPEHEEQAADALAAVTGKPVVLGHQLSLKLNSIQRATTATLNASLIAILQEFLAAMRAALDERGVTAPLMVVHGDGGLVDAAHATRRPVETVHSGPAASAIGGRFLAGVDRALVIDVGGTTTDLAILDGGQVTVREEGTSVGPYRTAVRAANVRSIGLGGDSQIAFNVENTLTIGPRRVVPISYLAHTSEAVAEDLQRVFGRLHQRPTPDHIEYWFLQREPRRFIDNAHAREVLDLLRQRPYSLPSLLERLGLYHPLQFSGQSFIQQEIIGRAALTPTDLLHLTGEYAPWNVEAAQIAADIVARLHKLTVDELIALTRKTMVERIVAEVVSFISGQTLTRTTGYAQRDDLGAWLFEESLYRQHPYLGSRITLKMPIIGIGAPAGIFLPEVAEILGTELILPEHHGVANAVGAVAGSVMISREAWVLPVVKDMHVRGYTVRAGVGAGGGMYRQLDEAMSHARALTEQLATEEALASGAVAPEVTFSEMQSGQDSFRVRARVVGRPRLSS